MNRAIVAGVLLIGMGHFQAAKEGNTSRLVLPNPGLLRCTSSDCSRLWSENPGANDVFPKQLIVDMNQNCIYGMTALYDKSVPVDDIKSAIDERYAKWVNAQFASSALKLWRVEPETFAIQLSVADKKDEKRNIAEAGTKQVIYIAFGGRSACNLH